MTAVATDPDSGVAGKSASLYGRSNAPRAERTLVYAQFRSYAAAAHYHDGEILIRCLLPQRTMGILQSRRRECQNPLVQIEDYVRTALPRGPANPERALLPGAQMWQTKPIRPARHPASDCIATPDQPY